MRGPSAKGLAMTRRFCIGQMASPLRGGPFGGRSKLNITWVKYPHRNAPYEVASAKGLAMTHFYISTLANKKTCATLYDIKKGIRRRA